MDDFDIEVYECRKCNIVQAHLVYRFTRKDGDVDVISTCDECNHETRTVLKS